MTMLLVVLTMMRVVMMSAMLASPKLCHVIMRMIMMRMMSATHGILKF